MDYRTVFTWNGNLAISSIGLPPERVECDPGKGRCPRRIMMNQLTEVLMERLKNKGLSAIAIPLFLRDVINPNTSVIKMEKK